MKRGRKGKMLRRKHAECCCGDCFSSPYIPVKTSKTTRRKSIGNTITKAYCNSIKPVKVLDDSVTKVNIRCRKCGTGLKKYVKKPRSTAVKHHHKREIVIKGLCSKHKNEVCKPCLTTNAMVDKYHNTFKDSKYENIDRELDGCDQTDKCEGRKPSSGDAHQRNPYQCGETTRNQNCRCPSLNHNKNPKKSKEINHEIADSYKKPKKLKKCNHEFAGSYETSSIFADPTEFSNNTGPFSWDSYRDNGRFVNCIGNGYNSNTSGYSYEQAENYFLDSSMNHDIKNVNTEEPPSLPLLKKCIKKLIVNELIKLKEKEIYENYDESRKKNKHKNKKTKRQKGIRIKCKVKRVSGEREESRFQEETEDIDTPLQVLYQCPNYEKLATPEKENYPNVKQPDCDLLCTCSCHKLNCNKKITRTLIRHGAPCNHTGRFLNTPKTYCACREKEGYLRFPPRTNYLDQSEQGCCDRVHGIPWEEECVPLRRYHYAENDQYDFSNYQFEARDDSLALRYQKVR